MLHHEVKKSQVVADKLKALTDEWERIQNQIKEVLAECCDKPVTKDGDVVKCFDDLDEGAIYCVRFPERDGDVFDDNFADTDYFTVIKVDYGSLIIRRIPDGAILDELFYETEINNDEIILTKVPFEQVPIQFLFGHRVKVKDEDRFGILVDVNEGDTYPYRVYFGMGAYNWCGAIELTAGRTFGE